MPASDPELQRAGGRASAVFLAFATVFVLTLELVSDDRQLSAILLQLGIALMLLGRLTGWLSTRVADELRPRLARAHVTSGVVAAVEEDWSSGGRNDYPLVRLTAGGETRTVSTARPHSGLRPGDAVRLHCDPLDPAWVVIDDGGLSKLERRARLLPAVGALAGAALLLAGLAGLLG